MSWEEELDEALEEAREDLGFPPIDDWEKEPGIGTAAVDMSAVRGKVMVDPEFAPQLSNTAKKGLMSHELGHPKKHPKDAKTAILENHWGKEYNNSGTVVNLFDDLVDNISLIMQGRDSQAEELEALYREISDNQHMVEDVIRRRYEEVSDIRHGTEGEFDYGSTVYDPEGEQKELLQVLQSIDFRRNEIIEDHEFYFHKFASAFDPHLDDMQQSGDGQGEPQQGEGQEQQQESGGQGDEYGEEQPSDIGGDVGVDSFSEDEIEDALDEIARDEDIDADEFEDILEDTAEEIGEGAGDQLNQKMDQAIATYYDSLSRQYNLKIEGSVANRVGTAPNGHKDWELGDRSDMIDPENSLGKVGMPGVTKTRKMDGYEMHGGQAEGKPDATIILDSSGSMQNPEEQTSYAVLGAFCAANSYLGNGSEVAVANFSSETEITNFTKDQTEVQEALVDYQAGGTNLDVEAIQELEGQKTEDTHSILITDAGIENFDDTVEYLENSHGRNTVLWINGEYDDLPEEYSELQEVPQTSLYHIQDESDIPNVVLGEVR